MQKPSPVQNSLPQIAFSEKVLCHNSPVKQIGAIMLTVESNEKAQIATQ